MNSFYVMPLLTGIAYRPYANSENDLPKIEVKPKPHGNIKVPDAVVARIRHMSEVERKTIRQVARAFPTLSESYLRRVREYSTRANVKAAP